MIKRMIIMLLLVGVVFGGIFAFQLYKAAQIKDYMKKNAEQLITVSAEKVRFESWQPQIKATGTLLAVNGSNIVPEVPGIVEKIYFNSGDSVNKSDPLLDLNADTEKAQLESLKAQVEMAKITYKRDQEQLKAQAISQAKVDEDLYDLKDKEAQQKEIEVLIEKKHIKAPFKGRLGICNLNPGNYLNTGDVIVTLQDTSALLIDFSLPQQMLPMIKVGKKIQLHFDMYPQKVFSGKITSINPIIDADTRNFLIEANVENPNGDLLPGMFGVIDLYTSEPQKFLTLPQTALTFNPYGTYVYVIEKTNQDNKENPSLRAVQRFVTTGDKRGDQVAILKGLKEGELVVTSGQMKLKNKAAVEIDNTVVPSNNPNVHIQDM
ncbi:MAG: efflux RND transporter periplasmic adaptor subunit [Proteobacteria bacterium]|nr:efflux RND transporter periplasmic adaptor subunit [Pseudomonadota bacterium]